MDTHAQPGPRTLGQEAVAEFILSFVQALLRAGYYLPGHPQAQRAKVGLHQRFQSLFQGRHELTFLVEDLGETKNILVEGALPEPQRLSALMAAGMAQVYVPRLAHFLERKDLLSVTLSESMPEAEFSQFIDVMSEAATGSHDADNKEQFLARLRESQVSHFSLMFKEDLVAVERRLPWRAQLAVSRLRKDLKHVPLFHNLDAAGMRRLRQQVLHDVLRPINRADLLAAILMNSDLAATREVPEEEIEAEIIQTVPASLILPTARAALPVHLAEADTQASARQRRALLKLLLNPRAGELPGTQALVRDLFNRGLIDFERLPPDLKALVTLERDTDRFVAERGAVLKRIEQTQEPEEYRPQAEALLRLVPELLRRNLLEEVVVLVTMFRGHAALGEPRAFAAGHVLGRLATGDLAAAFKDKFVTGKKEDRLALGPVYQALGEPMRPQLLEILKEAQDGWVRKNAAEVLLRMGPQATQAVLAALAGDRLPAAAVAELLMVFGELRSESEQVRQVLRQHARHADPHVREEAAWALCRVAGAAEEALFLDLLGDREMAVRRRALRCLRAARCPGGLDRVGALLLKVREDPSLGPLESHLYAALPELAEVAGTRGGPLEAFLLERLRETFPQGLLASLRGPRRPLLEDAFVASCEALVSIGSRPALDLLRELAGRVQEPGRQRLVGAVQRLEARLRQDG